VQFPADFDEHETKVELLTCLRSPFTLHQFLAAEKLLLGNIFKLIFFACSSASFLNYISEINSRAVGNDRCADFPVANNL
jgi:hypothetical protein